MQSRKGAKKRREDEDAAHEATKTQERDSNYLAALVP
jgi:hypothetical protein